ncbi:hypothetical protein [Kitasatospora sp. NPDC090308]|uniref:hypothetical protein n=1 Tax=Kitasatospora sp. NPDC090308 TaxID=3364082 RepID=UPI00382747FF
MFGGLHGRPWPELMPDQSPVLVVPSDPGRPVLAADGWADRDSALSRSADAHPGWCADLEGHHLVVCRTGGALWFEGEVAATREWRRRVRDRRRLLLVTGPFTSVFDFRPAAASGRLFFLSTAVRLLGDL